MNTKLLEYNFKYYDIFARNDCDWSRIARDLDLSQDFIEEFFFKLKPYRIQLDHKLSSWIMLKFGQSLNWKIMSKTQTISDYLLRKWSSKLDWKSVSRHQFMTAQFMKQFRRFLDPELVQQNQLLTEQKKKIVR